MMSPQWQTKLLQAALYSGRECDHEYPLAEMRQLPWKGKVQLNLKPALTMSSLRQIPTPIHPFSFLIRNLTFMSPVAPLVDSSKANLQPLLLLAFCAAMLPLISIEGDFKVLQSYLTSLKTWGDTLSISFVHFISFWKESLLSMPTTDDSFFFVDSLQYFSSSSIEQFLYRFKAQISSPNSSSLSSAENDSSDAAMCSSFLLRKDSQHFWLISLKYISTFTYSSQRELIKSSLTLAIYEVKLALRVFSSV